ncbi:hypothetical protein BS78_05G251900 [Paspalum vaginatum]|nr:hypothetical protein BS78_05G251900 [Paspalum vaginatum]
MVDLWNCIGQAANIAQLTGVDAAGLVTMILAVVQTVRRNKGDCQLLALRVAKISELLQKLQSQGTMQDESVWKPLDGLEDTLREAYVLVTSCQNSSAMSRFSMCGKEANQFREVNRRIDGYIELYPVVMHLDINQRLDRLGNAANGREKGAIVLSTQKQRCTWLCCQPHRKNRKAPCSPLFIHHQGSGSSTSTFRLSQLMRATNNFSDVNEIGRVGFGNVYKGQMDDGLKVTVKRGSSCIRLAEEFRNEVQIIMKLHHKNIVKLLGYCVQRGEMILVYEYIHIKSLEKLIFADKMETPLDWSIRFRIIKGISQGIMYLHDQCGTPIIHGDINPSNILLDLCLNPVIADFGFSKQVIPDAELDVCGVSGTLGYIDPLIFHVGKISTKSDVYSFGVVLIEIIAGKRNYVNPPEGCRSDKSILDHARELWTAGRALEIIDPSLHSEDNMTEILRCIQIALLCTEQIRPSMWDVFLMLCCENASVRAPLKDATYIYPPYTVNDSAESFDGVESTESITLSPTHHNAVICSSEDQIYACHMDNL